LLGIAVGCIGLTVEDFSSLTPTQFDSIYAEWKKRQDALLEEEWKQTRFIVWSSLRPYSEKLKVTDVFPLPSDNVKEVPDEAIEQEDDKGYEYYVKLWE